MLRILVLGSKPDPCLPEGMVYDRVFCANASPYSAKCLGLPRPDVTVMTALLTDGSDAGRKRIEALSGLSTDRLFFYPRPHKVGSYAACLWREVKNWRMTAWMLRRALNKVGFTYDRFIYRSSEDYRQLILRLCGNDSEILAQLDR